MIKQYLFYRLKFSPSPKEKVKRRKVHNSEEDDEYHRVINRGRFQGTSFRTRIIEKRMKRSEIKNIR